MYKSGATVLTKGIKSGIIVLRENHKCGQKAESEVNKMAKEKEILRKQLELLAEKSDECVALDDLILISNAMCNIANVLIALKK